MMALRNVPMKLKNETQASIFISEINLTDFFDLKIFVLVAIEKGKYLIPSRTQKSSPSSPMVLYARVRESRSLPSFFFAP